MGSAAAWYLLCANALRLFGPIECQGITCSRRTCSSDILYGGRSGRAIRCYLNYTCSFLPLHSGQKEQLLPLVCSAAEHRPHVVGWDCHCMTFLSFVQPFDPSDVVLPQRAAATTGFKCLGGVFNPLHLGCRSAVEHRFSFGWVFQFDSVRLRLVVPFVCECAQHV